LPPPFWPFTNISGTNLIPFTGKGFGYTHNGVLFGTHGFGFLFGNFGFGQTYGFNFTGIGITVNFGGGSIGFGVNGFGFGIGLGYNGTLPSASALALMVFASASPLAACDFGSSHLGVDLYLAG
jgi:hypothetical protein